MALTFTRQVVLRELSRLYDGLEARVERLKVARHEFDDCGPTVQLYRLVRDLPAAELQVREMMLPLPP